LQKLIKMIFVISDENDASTNEVLEWLLAREKHFVRINSNSRKVEILNVDLDKKQIEIQSGSSYIDSGNISSYWYRRGYLSKTYHSILKKEYGDLDPYIEHHLNNEWDEILRFFTTSLETNEEIISIGNYAIVDRKLDQLTIARQCGLGVPSTLITISKDKLLKFYFKCEKKVITKGISSSPSLTHQNISLEGYTEELTLAFIRKLPLTFFPSLFQENIDKQYELRIFFFHQQLYSMAIFSQEDDQTKIDVRKYNDLKPNRTVPYNLPDNIKKQLIDFMYKMKLDTGSIDMVVDSENNYIFLEVNPNGQFGMVSKPCNYYIEMEIANYL